MILTRTQRKIHDFLRENADSFEHPPTLDELCAELGLQSRGSLHKHIQALIEAGLVEPMNHKRRGVRLSSQAQAEEGLPLMGRIAAGQPIEAVVNDERMRVPSEFCGDKPCYVLQVSGDSMCEAGILDGDFVVVEHAEQAKNGEIVVALIDSGEVTLKRIEQRRGQVVLHPENTELQPQVYDPDRVRIQGVVVGQMRSYR